MNTKSCKKCGTTDRYPSGKCRLCGKKQSAEYSKAHPEKRRQYTATHKANHPGAGLLANRKYRANNPEKLKFIRRKSLYGLTPSEYDVMALKQNGLCAICGDKAPLQVDHCHETDTVRGLLCGKCNKAIGLLKDSPLVTNNATIYLTTYAPSTS